MAVLREGRFAERPLSRQKNRRHIVVLTYKPNDMKYPAFRRMLWGVLVLLWMGACDSPEVTPQDTTDEWIAAVDASALGQMQAAPPVFYDRNGAEASIWAIMKRHGVNTIRLRLWVDPSDGHSGWEEVNAASAQLHDLGFKTWLTVHYSDSWADPGQQNIPARWQGLDFATLKDSVYAYTAQVVTAMQPDFIQIGNEINTGLLHPYGHLSDAYPQFLALAEAGIAAVRDHNPDTQVMLHVAGIDGVEWFLERFAPLDYDLLGLSYYPMWHGKDWTAVQQRFAQIDAHTDKPLVIAETAYPFTLDWADWTNNIVGDSLQLVLPEFLPSPEGQRDFVAAVRQLVQGGEHGRGLCYWGGDWVAWRGAQATDGSPWENQALFDFNHQALPAIEALGQ